MIAVPERAKETQMTIGSRRALTLATGHLLSEPAMKARYSPLTDWQAIPQTADRVLLWRYPPATRFGLPEGWWPPSGSDVHSERGKENDERIRGKANDQLGPRLGMCRFLHCAFAFHTSPESRAEFDLQY